MEQSKFYQIKNITEHEYTLVGCDGSVITRPIRDIDKSASVFTIQDAKDGDVLTSDNKNCPFIYRLQTEFGHPVAYCGVRSDGKFISESPTDHLWCLKSEVAPATKEQCDTLMKAMADAGYIFDFEKKELKKIEQNIALSKFENKLCELFQKFRWYKDTPTNGDILEYVKTHSPELLDIAINEQNPAWSEEDEKIISDAEVWLDTLCDYLKDSSSAYIPNVRVVISKLKSLRPQNKWKPSVFHLECIEDAIAIYEKRGINAIGLKEILEELKKLKN